MKRIFILQATKIKRFGQIVFFQTDYDKIKQKKIAYDVIVNTSQN